MRKTLFSILPLVVLLVPIAARLRPAVAPGGPHHAAVGTVEASALLPEQAALGGVHARIRAARTLLEAVPESPVTDAVVLAVADAAGAASSSPRRT